MKYLLWLLGFFMLISCNKESGWKLVWEENFDGIELDTSVWSRIPRGKPDWQNTQSFDDRCYEMRNGLLILKGIVNDNLEADTATYLKVVYGQRIKNLFIVVVLKYALNSMVHKVHGLLFGLCLLKQKSTIGRMVEKWIFWNA